MRCNCPCYRTRPKLRLINRVVLLILCVLLRIIASILYSIGGRILLVALCAASIVFILVSLAFDYYHYRMWWHYRPAGDNIGGKYCSAHRRYLPYHMLGEKRDPMTLGDEPCSRTPCNNRKLEHILICHYSDYNPQQRWPEISSETDIYIGFHRRNPKKAIEMAHNGMELSKLNSDVKHTNPRDGTESKDLMLGIGIYFARSIDGTKGKARTTGAIMCAEIRMGKVRVIERADIPSVINSNAWHQEYDTIYYKTYES